MRNLKDIRASLSGRLKMPDAKTLFAYISIFLMTWITMSRLGFKGLYMDDLDVYENWLDFGENLWAFTWQSGSNRFRPVSNFFMGLGFLLTGSYTELLWFWMLIINVTTAVVAYRLFAKMTENAALSLGGTLLFILSRCSYYAIGQYHGVMEQVSTILALFVLYFCLKALADPDPQKSVILATVFAFIAVFSHERYMSLPVFVALTVLLLSSPWKKKLVWLGGSLGALIAVLLIRGILFGSHAWAGTGGSDLVETFSISRIFLYILQGCGYLFGINAGPETFSGYTYADVPKFVYLLGIVAAAIFVISLWRTLRHNPIKAIWKKYFLLIAFIGATLVVSCTTIRLELRWLYTPYAGFLLMLLLLLKDGKFNKPWLKRLVPTVALVFMLLAEITYHNGFGSIYCWDPQNLYNQIYELTWVKHAYNLEDMQITIVSGGVDHINQEEMERFFQIYARSRGQKAPEVTVFDDVKNMTMTGREDLILTVDRSLTLNENLSRVNNTTREMILFYQHIAPAGNTIREAEDLTGFHGWELNKAHIWGEQVMTMVISSGATGEAYLHGLLSNYDSANELTIYFEDQLIGTYPINVTEFELTFQLPPNTEGKLRLELDHAYSPYDMGAGADQRVLGLCIADLYIQ